MSLMEKQRRVKDSKRPGYAVFKRKRQMGLLPFVLLAVLVLAGLAYLLPGAPQETSEGSAGQAGTSADQEPSEDAAEAGGPAPEDPTLYLTVPKLGLRENKVRNDRSEFALGLGAIKLPDTGFPWQKEANTYIACHRLGFPATESYNQCLDLPSMQKGDEVILEDANGTVYDYQVSDILVVSPNDTWVTEPVAGRDMVSLQTCIESPGDFTTLGPDWAARIVVRADRVV